MSSTILTTLAERARVAQPIPADRLVTAEDIANVVAFLCSEEAFMIRGQIITVDGGFSLLP